MKNKEEIYLASHSCLAFLLIVNLMERPWEGLLPSVATIGEGERSDAGNVEGCCGGMGEDERVLVVFSFFALFTDFSPAPSVPAAEEETLECKLEEPGLFSSNKRSNVLISSAFSFPISSKGWSNFRNIPKFPFNQQFC